MRGWNARLKLSFDGEVGSAESMTQSSECLSTDNRKYGRRRRLLHKAVNRSAIKRAACGDASPVGRSGTATQRPCSRSFAWMRSALASVSASKRVSQSGRSRASSSTWRQAAG